MLRITLIVFCITAGLQAAAQSTAELIKRNKEALEIVIPPVTNEPGLGNNEGGLQGIPVKLPPGIRIVQRPHKPFDPDPQLLYGVANTFYVDISYVYDDSAAMGNPVPAYLPAGTMFGCVQENSMQNGIMLSRMPFELKPRLGPGGKKRDTVTVYVGVACLNEHRALPWEENVQKTPDVRDYPIAKGMYTMGPVTSHQGLRMLADLLDQYPKLRLKQHYNPQAQFEEGYVGARWQVIYGMIQEMVWKVTDGPGITRGELEHYKEELAPYK